MLQRANELLGLTIHATDGEIGRVPEYDPSRPVTESALARLTAGYGRPARQPSDPGCPTT